MRFAVDSSIVLDILLNDPDHGAASQELLEEHLARGAVVICPVAFSECAVALAPPSDFISISAQMSLVYDAFTPESCTLAAQMWQEYRKRGGPRTRIMSDFLIGAHAQRCANGLLSRDRGFFRRYFRGLVVVQP